MNDKKINLTEDVYYFGCANSEVGHRLINKHGHYISEWSVMAMCDSNLLPIKCIPLDNLHYSVQERGRSEPQGLASIHHVILDKYSGRWTILTFWDRSVDSRYGSKSCLLVRGYLNFQQMIGQFREHFPDIFKRYPFRIEQYKA